MISLVTGLIYAFLMLGLLAVNLLYFFQAIKYRLKNDLTLVFLSLHVMLMVGVQIVAALFLLGFV